MLNIRLAYKSLFWSPSCSENSSNKAMKVQLSWFLEGESEIIIQHNSSIMEISNALTQAHATDINTVNHHFFNNGNHWAIFIYMHPNHTEFCFIQPAG